MAKRVAITGATGFIGQKLVMRHLEQGDHVRILSRRLPGEAGLPNSLQWFQGDLNSAGNLDAFVDGADVLYHCAGEIRNVLRMEAVHVLGTRHLAEAAMGRIGHWVQLSSVGVYGSATNSVITENSVLNPVGQYEITKTKSDQIIVEVANKGGFNLSILRPSNVYGDKMTNQSLFNMVAMISRGLFFYIGKPGASANYIHVDNVVEGLMSCGALQHSKGRVYNLSDYCTLEHFVELIAHALGRSSPRLRVPESAAYLTAMTLGWLPSFPLTQSRVKALVNRSKYPILKIQDELGYQHVVSMEDGLRWLVESYKQRIQYCELQ